MFEARWLGTCLAVAVLSTAARGGVIVVNASGGGDYTSIASAVAAAQDGDTILVKAGNYGGFTLSGKSLSIVADTGAVVTVQDVVTVSNLTAIQTVVFGGLGIQSNSYAPALRVDTNQGSFRAHGCTFVGRDDLPGFQSYGAQLGTYFGSGPAAAFVDCDFRGGDQGVDDQFDGYSGAAALSTSGSSQVALYDCTLVGGDASSGHVWMCREGGPGASLWQPGAFLHASGSSFEGGQGGFGCDFGIPVGGGTGGAGVYLGNGAVSWFVESSFTGGPPGGPMTGCAGVTGLPGPEFGGSGQHFHFPVGELEMEAPWLAREGNQVTLTIRGEPGVEVSLESSRATQFVGAASWRGVDLVRESKFSEPAVLLGTMPPSGVMTVALPIPLLPQRIKADTLFLQVRRWGPNGLVIGSFAALTVLDSAY